MKKLTLFLLASTIVMFLFGCGGGGSPSPTPNPANDNSYKGVYKGVLTGTGSTGHFWIDAYNTDATKLELSLTFTNVSLDNVEGTQTLDGSNYVYTFSSNGCVMIFEVSPTGSVISDLTSLVCTGSTGTITVVADKATSTTDVSIWEGTETNSGGSCAESGIWNVIVKGLKIAGTVMVTTSDCSSSGLSGDIVGTKAGNAVTCTADSGNVTATGTVDGSSMSGTWAGDGLTGTFEGSNTL